jgi:glycine dehydrogenase subunit 1
MGYTVHTDDDRRRMLQVIGLTDVAELFAAVPSSIRRTELRLAPGLSEPETRQRMEILAAGNLPLGESSFLGAGCYNHYVPSTVRALASRSEFATAYTPYQAEVSQGTLQHIFEFQTCIAELTGLEAANASLYDGPSALAEAAFMALRLTQRESMLISEGVHPEAVRVVETYSAGPGLKLMRMPLDPATGATPARSQGIPAGVGAVLVQQPNCLGVVEDLAYLAEAAHNAGALLVVTVNPGTLGVLEAPGKLGADIVVGDAQVFGNAPSFGGPSVGFLACSSAHLRQLPGRVVGQTTDSQGRTCYVLTLQAREQHIRRAKATSNICSNQALSALAATIHLALLGPHGLRERGELCLQRAHYLKNGLCALPGVTLVVTGPFFSEFALALPFSAQHFRRDMRRRGIDPGVPLTQLEQSGSPVLSGPAERVLLVAVTEVNTPVALDSYIAAAREVLASRASSAAPATRGPR